VLAQVGPADADAVLAPTVAAREHTSAETRGRTPTPRKEQRAESSVQQSASETATVSHEGDHLALSPVIAAASAASSAAQARMLTATRLELGLIILASVGGMLAWVIPPVIAAILSVAGFAGAFLLGGYVARARPERQWYDGRAAAESCKTLAWRYAVGGQPFGLRTAGERATDEAYVESIDEVIESLEYAAAKAGSGAQITEEMRTMRGASLDVRRTAYEMGRIEDQQDWYADKAKFNRGRAEIWRTAVLVLEFSGLVLGLATIAFAVAIDFIGVIAAVAAAVMAWLQVKQHETLARAYSVASGELAAIRSLTRHQGSEDDWAEFVAQAEEAISREHTLWRASRDVRVPTGLRPRPRTNKA
jgi:hypothetical protein